MKIIVPDYYKQFQCISGACKHSCCKGWEIDIDEDSARRYGDYPDINEHISFDNVPHFILNGENCPFLRNDGLCQMIIDHGEDFLCQICADHPRFRNFWSDRIEMGLGLACEEAARIILGSDHPLKLIVLEDDEFSKESNEYTVSLPDNSLLPEDEAWLMELRSKMLSDVQGNGPEARLLEYLIYRHIADALYDDRLEERIAFIQKSYDYVLDEWDQTDGSLEAIVECARKFSVEKEYVE